MQGGTGPHSAPQGGGGGGGGQGDGEVAWEKKRKFDEGEWGCGTEVGKGGVWGLGGGGGGELQQSRTTLR